MRIGNLIGGALPQINANTTKCVILIIALWCCQILGRLIISVRVTKPSTPPYLFMAMSVYTLMYIFKCMHLVFYLACLPLPKPLHTVKAPYARIDRLCTCIKIHVYMYKDTHRPAPPKPESISVDRSGR